MIRKRRKINRDDSSESGESEEEESAAQDVQVAIPAVSIAPAILQVNSQVLPAESTGSSSAEDLQDFRDGEWYIGDDPVSWQKIEYNLRGHVWNKHSLPVEDQARWARSTPHELMQYYLPVLDLDDRFLGLFHRNEHFRQEVIFLLGRIHEDFLFQHRARAPIHVTTDSETHIPFFNNRAIIVHSRGFEFREEMPENLLAEERNEQAAAQEFYDSLEVESEEGSEIL
jgi:hypothetical protein